MTISRARVMPAVPVIGSYTHANNTTETQVLEILNTSSVVRDFAIVFDLSAITKNNFKLNLYMKINGTNYVLHTLSTFGVSNDAGQFEELATSCSLKITAQSSIVEGASRVLPYRYSLVNR